MTRRETHSTARLTLQKLNLPSAKQRAGKGKNMNEQMQKQFHKRQYPLVRYLGLLLAVALLFTGVTFARYATNSGIATSIGIAAFDATYSIDRVNSTTFGNQDYYIEANGTHVPLGTTALSVQMTLKNDGDTDVASTVILSGPAEYWDNLALQIAGADENGDAGTPLTPQLVLKDLLYDKKIHEGGSPHEATYGDYKNWNEAEKKTLDTGASLDYGERTDTVEKSLTMNGSLAKPQEGSDAPREVTATWQDGEGENAVTNTLRITAKEEVQQYDVGFARKDGSDILPPVYVECEKNMTVYTLEFTLPALDVAKKTEQSLVLFLNWTTEIVNGSISANQDFWDRMEKGESFDFENKVSMDPTVALGDKITVLGYHYDVTGVPVVQKNEDGAWEETGETTTVRVKKTFASKDGAMQGNTEYFHVASLNDSDGNYAHDFLEVEGSSGILQCDNKSSPGNITYVKISDIESAIERPSSSVFDTVTLVPVVDESGNDIENSHHAPIYQRGFLVTFAAAFVQSSEVPAAQQP